MLIMLKALAELLQSPFDGLDVAISDVCIDHRKITPGSLFIALKGARFDGHEFVQAAKDNGAVAALVERQVECDLPQLVIKDTYLGLGTLAKFHRQKFQLPVIALTGSCGKTSVKEMIASILRQSFCTFASKGNLNNHVGVPLSLLSLSQEHEVAVFELGANHPGEIAYTVSLVEPDAALITNIAPAHVEGFGSIDGVFEAKSEIYAGLHPDGTAIINNDSDYAKQFWQKTEGLERLSFGLTDADVSASNIARGDDGCYRFVLKTPKGERPISLSLPGEHQVSNALAASAASLALDISLDDIKAGLEQVEPVSGRLCIVSGIKQSRLIDDCYNANPKSVAAGIEFLASFDGARYLVLGDMGELGEEAKRYHFEVGQLAKQRGIDKLFTVGELSVAASEGFGDKAQHFNDQAGLLNAISPLMAKGVTCLVKGSLSSNMKPVVEALIATEPR